jgi:hypothetical protein
MKSGLVWIGLGRRDGDPVNPGVDSAGGAGAGVGVWASAGAPSVGSRLRARQATAVDQRGRTPAGTATLRTERVGMDVARRGMISRRL